MLKRLFIFLICLFLSNIFLLPQGQDLKHETKLRDIEQKALLLEVNGDYKSALAQYMKGLDYISSNFKDAADLQKLLAGYAEIFLLQAEKMIEKNNLFTREVPFLEKFVNSKFSQSFHRHLLYHLGYAYFRASNITRGKTYFKRLGITSEWYVIGPFNNEGNIGFNKEYPPEKTLNFDESYQGILDEVTWLKLPFETNTGYVDFSTLMYPNKNGVGYAATFINAVQDTILCLSIATNSSVKVWIDDTLLYMFDGSRECTLDHAIINLTLSKGFHKVLVKSANLENEEWGIRVTFFNPVTFENDIRDAIVGIPKQLPKDYGKIISFDVKKLTDNALEIFSQYKTDDALHIFNKGIIYKYLKNFDAPERLDEKSFYSAHLQDKNFVPYRFYYALSSLMSGKIKAEAHEDIYRNELESIIQSSPDLKEPYYELIKYYLFHFGSLEKTKELIELVEAKFKEKNTAAFKLLKLDYLQKLAKQSDAYKVKLRLFKEKISKETELLEFIRIKAELLEEKYHYVEAINEYLKILHKNYIDMNAHWAIINLYLKQMDIEKARREIDKIIQLNPYDLSAYYKKIELLESIAEYTDALDILSKLLGINHRNPTILKLIGKNLEFAEAPKEALYFYKSALKLLPTDSKLKRYIDLISAEEKSKDSITTQRINWQEVPLDKAVLTGSRMLQIVNNKVIKVSEIGTKTEYVQEVYKILDKSAIQEFKQINLWYYKDEQELKVIEAKIYHSDGSVEEAEISDYPGVLYDLFAAKTCTFAKVDVGDVVEIIQEITDLQQGWFGDYFGETFYFSYYHPTLVSRLTIQAPNSKNLYYLCLNGATEPKIVSDDKTTTYSWEMRNLPEITQEPGMPPLEEIRPLVRVSSFKTWKDLANWYWSALYEKQEDISPKMKEKIEELTKTLNSTEDKIKAIYRFVVKEIQYNDKWEFGIHGYKPYKASQVFERRFGDCKDKSLLLNTMLKFIGVNSYPVLVKLSDTRGRENFDLPMFGYFNHAISCVIINGEKWFLDGTATYWGSKETSSALTGAKALLVMKDNGEIVEIPYLPLDSNYTTIEAKFNVNQDLSAIANYNLESSGNVSSHYRYLFQDKEKAKVILEKYFGKTYAGTKVLDIIIKDGIDNLETSPKVEYKVEIPNFIKSLDKDKYVLTLFTSDFELTRLANLSKRKYDLILPVTPKETNRQYELELPSNLSISKFPKELLVDNKYFKVSGSYSVQKNIVSAKLREVIKLTRVSKDDYEQFRNDIIKVNQWLSETIMIEKK